MRKAVGGLLALDLRCDRLWHSPWKRAAQTAELLLPIVSGESHATELLARAPSAELLALARGTPRADAAERARAGRALRVALVGHQPWMGELLALLVTGSDRAGEAALFGKGGVAWLVGECQPGGMQVRALFPPRVLRALGRH
jgi:phosphohistidine phosphatase